MTVLQDLTGVRSGNWVVVEKSSKKGTSDSFWECRCDCGSTAVVASSTLRSGSSTKCRSCSNRGTPFRYLYTSFVRSAKRRQKKVLTYDEFVGFTSITECHYCGDNIVWHKHNFGNDKCRGNRGYHLDRKDNNMDYTKGNVVVCCTRCNRAKLDHFSYEEWLKLGAVIKTFSKLEALPCPTT